jgi:hypothetical protein
VVDMWWCWHLCRLSMCFDNPKEADRAKLALTCVAWSCTLPRACGLKHGIAVGLQQPVRGWRKLLRPVWRHWHSLTGAAPLGRAGSKRQLKQDTHDSNLLLVRMWCCNQDAFCCRQPVIPALCICRGAHAVLIVAVSAMCPCPCGRVLPPRPLTAACAGCLVQAPLVAWMLVVLTVYAVSYQRLHLASAPLVDNNIANRVLYRITRVIFYALAHCTRTQDFNASRAALEAGSALAHFECCPGSSAAPCTWRPDTKGIELSAGSLRASQLGMKPPEMASDCVLACRLTSWRRCIMDRMLTVDACCKRLYAC